MEIAVVDDEKAIREHICALIEAARGLRERQDMLRLTIKALNDRGATNKNLIKEDEIMAISGVTDYTNTYAGYTNSANSKKQVIEETSTAKETGSADRKTAADELSYLSSKYSNYSFVAANYTKGMQYGSSSTVNVTISPQFLAKMASDPELEKEYEKQIAGMQECDEQNARQVAAGGWHIVAQGWAIDKDGGISSWSIVQKNDTKSHLQTMSENAEKIRKQNEEKKQEKAELEEKRQANREEKKKLQEKLDEAGKEQFNDKWKGVVIISKYDENVVVPKADKDNAGITGLNMDLKV